MSGSEKKPLRGSRLTALQFRSAIRAELDEFLSPPLNDTLAELMRLTQLRTSFRKVAERVGLDKFHWEIEEQTAVLAERFLSDATDGRPEARLAEFIREIEDERTAKLLGEYLEVRKHRRIVDVIDAESFGWNRSLARTDEFGHGMDERILEFPLALEVCAFTKPGRVLDAGCALNHGYIRKIFDPPVAALVHFTQSGEKEEARFAGSQVSYVFGDLRAMPFPDAHFDRIVCISTLEHVGMDNGRYGSAAEQAPESSLDAVQDLMRVLRPGGTLLITVPYGTPADLGWFRVFGPEDIAALIGRSLASSSDTRYYRSEGAWVTADSSVAGLSASIGAHDAVGGLAAIRLVK